LVDTTDASTTGDSDSDITTFSPSCAPWVLDNPVVVSISDDEHGVVVVGSAGTWGDDSTSVSLEDSLISLDGDGNGSLVDSSLKLVRVILGNVVHVLSADSSETSVVSAALSAALISVGVVFLERVTVGVGPGLFHPSTVATTVGEVAVNKLLLWERKELAGSDFVMSFESTCWWEGPAWSALALVLHTSDSTSASPVLGVTDIGGIENGVGLVLSFNGSLISEHALEFLGGQVGKVVDTNGGGLGTIIACFKSSHSSFGGFEGLESEVVLLFSAEVLAIGGNEVGEFLLSGINGGEEGGGSWWLSSIAKGEGSSAGSSSDNGSFNSVFLLHSVKIYNNIIYNNEVDPYIYTKNMR
jgi:hypothetical protein